nr:MAG TPA: hypothetical protein [Caudoviricetes sp.]
MKICNSFIFCALSSLSAGHPPLPRSNQRSFSRCPPSELTRKFSNRQSFRCRFRIALQADGCLLFAPGIAAQHSHKPKFYPSSHLSGSIEDLEKTLDIR